MRLIFLLLALAASIARCYMEAGERITGSAPAPGQFRSFFFLRKFSPYGSIGLERSTPFGVHKRIESEEKYSPFQSVIMVHRRRQPDHVLNSVLRQIDGTDNFIKDFLNAHLQHVRSGEHAQSEQFDTERIYKDIYKRSKYPPAKNSKGVDMSEHAFGDEIDSIIANAVKETTPEHLERERKMVDKYREARSKHRNKHEMKKKLKKAKSALNKGYRVSGITIILFILIGVISGYIGYSMNSRTAMEHYVPLSK